jgi:hypothetical protein
MLTKREQMKRHTPYVSRLTKTVSGFAFYHAPFDIIDKSGHFYEVKCPSDRLGKHEGECRISISEDELKFGEMGIYERLFFKGGSMSPRARNRGGRI